MKLRKFPKIVVNVAKIRASHSGANEPINTPKAMATMILGSKPKLNFTSMSSLYEQMYFIYYPKVSQRQKKVNRNSNTRNIFIISTKLKLPFPSSNFFPTMQKAPESDSGAFVRFISRPALQSRPTLQG
jgi:hypothetical protein